MPALSVVTRSFLSAESFARRLNRNAVSMRVFPRFVILRSLVNASATFACFSTTSMAMFWLSTSTTRSTWLVSTTLLNTASFSNSSTSSMVLKLRGGRCAAARSKSYRSRRTFMDTMVTPCIWQSCLIILFRTSRSLMFPTSQLPRPWPMVSSTASAQYSSLSLMYIPMGPIGGCENSFARLRTRSTSLRSFCGPFFPASLSRSSPLSALASLSLDSRSFSFSVSSFTAISAERTAPCASRSALARVSARASISSTRALSSARFAVCASTARCSESSCACDCCCRDARACSMAVSSSFLEASALVISFACAITLVSARVFSRKSVVCFWCAAWMSAMRVAASASNSVMRLLASSNSAWQFATVSAWSRMFVSSVGCRLRRFSPSSSVCFSMISDWYTSAHARRRRYSVTCSRSFSMAV
mmetsp:Transcript_14167/g.60631  ORF Transcript_14167/g.60631 Transcript_14167/m.60631 type:complete len:418 (-) Transcript_14167:865-2118(-)